MGLDLFLYKREQWEKENEWNIQELKRMEVENDANYQCFFGDLEELAYGRKTWSIYNFFSLRPDAIQLDEDVYEITKDAYLEFCAKAEPYKDYLEAIHNSSGETELDSITAEFIYNEIFKNTYELGPQLGYEWDCRVIYTWAFTQRDTILKAFEEDSIVICASW